MAKSKPPRKDCRVLLWEIAACADDASQLLRTALRGIPALDVGISACIAKAAQGRRALNAFLQRALLTPIDREDVCLLAQDAVNAVQAVCCAAAVIYPHPALEAAKLVSAAADCACAVPALYALLRDKAEPAAMHAACEALRKSAWNSTMLYLRLKRQASGVPDALLHVFEACVRVADRMEYVLIKNN